MRQCFFVFRLKLPLPFLAMPCPIVIADLMIDSQVGIILFATK
jgi:hypothetical protein